jgi:hypothetical protein
MSMVQDWRMSGERRPVRRPLIPPTAQSTVQPAPLPASLLGEPVGARRWAEVSRLRGSMRDPVIGRQLVLLILVSLLSLAVMSVSIAANRTLIRSLREPGFTRTAAVAALTAAPPAGRHELRAAPSIDAAGVERILAQYGSPAVGTGELWYRLGVERGIDPAYAVAFFIHESAAGTAAGWAGLKPDGSTTHNVGNIICAGYASCYGRFRDYPDWAAGIADWYRLIDVEYLQWRGLATVADIIPVYAPSVENNVELYITTIEGLVDDWRINGVR